MLPFLVSCGLILINIVGLLLADYFGTLIFLDTIGTAIAGLAFGPIWGGFVGALTNLLISRLHGYGQYLKFLHVNVFCGVAWGLLREIYPVMSDSGSQIILYIVVLGFTLAVISLILSTPLRCYLGFSTDHLLDKVDRKIYELPASGTIARDWSRLGQIRKLGKVLGAEFLLSHFVDKAISTTVAVMFVLIVNTAAVGGFHVDPRSGIDIKATYHDLIEFLGACYYLALGVAIKTWQVDVASQAVVALLGPLGFFGALIAVPVLFEIMGLH